MNEVRGFLLKGAAACVVSAAVVAGLVGVNAAMTGDEQVFTATAAGMMGDVSMTATLNGSKITDIRLDVSGETPEIGGAAGPELVEQCLEAQGSDIDGVAGATVTTNAVKACLDDCIAQSQAG